LLVVQLHTISPRPKLGNYSMTRTNVRVNLRIKITSCQNINIGKKYNITYLQNVQAYFVE